MLKKKYYIHVYIYIYLKTAPTSLVGLHQRLVDVVVGGVGVTVGLLPLVQLLSDGAQGIVDLGGRGVRQVGRLLRRVDLLTHICSSQRKQDQNTTRKKTT